MKNVTILRDTVAGGKTLKAGETVQLSDQDANTLVLMGKAVKVEDKTAAPAPKPKGKKEAPAETEKQPQENTETTDEEGDESTSVLDDMTKKELVDYAESIGLPNLNGLNKADIIASIKEFEKNNEAE